MRRKNSSWSLPLFSYKLKSSEKAKASRYLMFVFNPPFDF